MTRAERQDPPAGELSLTLLVARFALCRLPANAAVPPWTTHASTFLTISRTPTELSIVADEDAMPPETKAERGFRALRVEGPLPLELVGIAASIAVPLAAAGVAIFPIATYDTDYVLLRETALAPAIVALRAAGHVVDDEGDRS